MATSHPIPTHVSLPIPTNPNFKNLTDRVFGRWTVMYYVGRLGIQPLWLCRCSCGTTRPVSRNSLLSGSSQSCGCARVDSTRTHGLSTTPEYQAWNSMMARCYVETTERYPNYGGRGITVCERWWSIENFVTDMGPRPADKTSIERLDNNANYEPGNCAWANDTEQANNRRSSRLLDLDGDVRTVAEWSKATGLGRWKIMSRLRRGWSVKDALTKAADVGLQIHPVTFRGQTRSLSEWSRITGIKQPTIRRRLKAGWSIANALRVEAAAWSRRPLDVSASNILLPATQN